MTIFPSFIQNKKREREKKKEGIKRKHSQAQRNIPIPITIILLKHIRHPLQTDARLHKQVETHVVVPPAIVRRVEELHKLVAKAVPKGNQGIGEFLAGNAARAVAIEAVEEVAPGGEEAPQTAGEADVSALIFVFAHVEGYPRRWTYQNSSKLTDPERSVSNILHRG